MPSTDGVVQTMAGSVYGEVVNESLLNLFQPGHTVLDIGCGTGAWAEALRARGAKRLIGVEISAAAAAEADTRYDEVLREPIERLDLAIAGIDTIIVADVLEHLLDPWSEIERWRPWASQLVVSVPNLQSVDLLWPLLRGHFTYQDGGGLMDRTHIHWFTHESIGNDLKAAGWTPTVWGEPEGRRGRVNRAAGGRIRNFLGRQIQVVAA